MTVDQFSEVQISYSNKVPPSKRIKVKGSKDAEQAFRTVWPDITHIEYCYILLMNRQNQVLGFHQLSKGGITGSIIDVRVVFQLALKACATTLILAHNHPSGNLDPSEADKRITNQLKQAGAMLDIPVLDHIILTEDSYFSMADEGLL